MKPNLHQGQEKSQLQQEKETGNDTQINAYENYLTRIFKQFYKKQQWPILFPKKWKIENLSKETELIKIKNQVEMTEEKQAMNLSPQAAQQHTTEWVAWMADPYFLRVLEVRSQGQVLEHSVSGEGFLPGCGQPGVSHVCSHGLSSVQAQRETKTERA